MFFWNCLPRLLDRRRMRVHAPWQQTILIAWAGMRGVDSLAAALAVPLVLADGVTPFPQRSMILFLAFSVILATLVMQGLTMPLLIRRLRFPVDEGVKREETEIRLAAAEAARSRLEELAPGASLSPATIDHLRVVYQNHLQRYQSRLAPASEDAIEPGISTTSTFMLELLKTERRTILALKAGGEFSDEAIQRVERSLDYEELHLNADGRERS